MCLGLALFNGINLTVNRYLLIVIARVKPLI